MRNKAFQRALVCLAHPLSLGAILLLLVNDHLLKRHWPSWWTGKAGDFAWLLFAPFITAALLAWLLPSRIEQQEEGVGLWAIALTGLVFSLAKTLPTFHTLMVHLLEALLGCAVGLRRDPTDLIALPSLLLAWRLWKHHAAHTHRLSHLKWVALVLATLSTVATTPIPPDYGVVCLQAQDDAIVATANFHRNGAYDRFLSQDGGWTWQAIERGYDPLDCSHDDPWILTDPIIPSVQYRFTSGRSIERSDYRTATAFAFALALAVIVAGDQWLRHVTPIPSPRPKPAEMPQAMTLLHAGWKLWLQWLLGNAVGLGVGSLIAYIGITFSALTTGGPAVRFTGVLAIAATGALVSSIQWYVMQRHGNWAGEWSKWTLLSAAGWSIGGISGSYLLLGLTSGRLSIIAGVFCGIAQWLILRRRVNRAGWWILASAVGWLAGTLIELLFLGNPDWFSPIGLVVNGFIVGGVSGSISGVCLVWLLRRSATVPLPNDVESHEQQATKI